MKTLQKTLPWKQTVFRFLSAQTISLFGSSLVQYAIIWHITLSTSSGTMLTISTLCGFVPQILISLFAGVWIDRHSRKTMILLADGMIAIATLLLAATFFAGYQNLVLLFAVLVVRSIGTGIQTPAVQSLFPQIVPAEHLMRMGGIQSTLSSIMMFAAPAVSGMLLSFAPIQMVLLIDVATAIIGISITASLSLPSQISQTVAQSGWQDFLAGFSYLKKHAHIARLLLFQMIVLFLISPSAFLTPLLVSRTFGAEVWRLTASEMTYSLGMVLGGVIIASWGGFPKKLHTTLLAGACYGLPMVSIGAAPAFLVYLLCNTLIGITSPCYSTPVTVTIQQTVEPAMHGRIFGLLQIATSCAFPLGMVLFGPLADRFPVQGILIAAGVAVLLVCLLAWHTKSLTKST